MNKPSRRIIGSNFLVILASAIISHLPIWGDGLGVGAQITQAVVILVLLVWNISEALNPTSVEVRQAHWLGLLLVLLIGIGTCALPPF